MALPFTTFWNFYFASFFTTGKEIPWWLSSETSITLYDAVTLPGVIEFSIAMFFSRMVGYTFLFWLPVFMKKTNSATASHAAYYSLSYVLGGSIGGILAGIFVDLTKRTAVGCALFLVLSIPVLLVGIVADIGVSITIFLFLFCIIKGHGRRQNKIQGVARFWNSGPHPQARTRV